MNQMCPEEKVVKVKQDHIESTALSCEEKELIIEKVTDTLVREKRFHFASRTQFSYVNSTRSKLGLTVLNLNRY